MFRREKKSELSSQISAKSKSELIVIEGLLKTLLSLLKENCLLNFKQLSELFGSLKCLMTDVHSDKVLKMHFGLFSSTIQTRLFIVIILNKWTVFTQN